MLCGRVGEHENMRKSSHANWWSSKMFSWIIRRCKSLPTVCKPFCARKKNVTDGSSRHCCATWSSKESAKAQNSFCWFIMLMLCHHRDEASFTRQDSPLFSSPCETQLNVISAATYASMNSFTFLVDGTSDSHFYALYYTFIIGRRCEGCTVESLES